MCYILQDEACIGNIWWSFACDFNHDLKLFFPEATFISPFEEWSCNTIQLEQHNINAFIIFTGDYKKISDPTETFDCLGVDVRFGPNGAITTLNVEGVSISTQQSRSVILCDNDVLINLNECPASRIFPCSRHFYVTTYSNIRPSRT